MTEDFFIKEQTKIDRVQKDYPPPILWVNKATAPPPFFNLGKSPNPQISRFKKHICPNFSIPKKCNPTPPYSTPHKCKKCQKCCGKSCYPLFHLENNSGPIFHRRKEYLLPFYSSSKNVHAPFFHRPKKSQPSLFLNSASVPPTIFWSVPNTPYLTAPAGCTGVHWGPPQRNFWKIV